MHEGRACGMESFTPNMYPTREVEKKKTNVIFRSGFQ